MKKIVIFGNGDLAKLLLWYINKDTNREVVAFCVNQEFLREDVFCNLPVVPFENLVDNYSITEFEILVAIGNSGMNDIRKKVFLQCKNMGYDIASYIHSSCSMNTNEIEEGNIILENSLIYPFSKIGKGNLLWDHVLISHDCVVGDFNTFSSYADLCGYVKIGNNGYFGKHCILQDFITIADYTLVGAGAYVKNSTKPYDIVVPPRSYKLENRKSTDMM